MTKYVLCRGKDGSFVSSRKKARYKEGMTFDEGRYEELQIFDSLQEAEQELAKCSNSYGVIASNVGYAYDVEEYFIIEAEYDEDDEYIGTEVDVVRFAEVNKACCDREALLQLGFEVEEEPEDDED